MEPTAKHFKSIFLSDIHLGTKGCQSERLLDFLYKHTCDKLYLVGDIIDGWKLEQRIYWPQEHTNVIRKFLSFAKNGTEVIYVTGNHDEFLRSFSPLNLGNIKMVDKVEHITNNRRWRPIAIVAQRNKRQRAADGRGPHTCVVSVCKRNIATTP